MDRMTSSIYKTNTGDIKLPFASLDVFQRFSQAKPNASELRALDNMYQFLKSLMIMCRRLRANLTKFKVDSWVEVDFDELFLDTQGLFLFVSQFLEDSMLVVRLSLDGSIRAQMPGKFSEFTNRLMRNENLLPPGHPLRTFLEEDAGYLGELKDIRDDICHRTAFGRARSAQFPNYIDFVRSAGGGTVFASASDLRAYLSSVIRKVLSLACLFDEYVVANFKEMGLATTYLPLPAVILPFGRIDLNASGSQPVYPPGFTVMTVGKDAYDSLMFFLEGNARTGDDSAEFGSTDWGSG